MTSLEPRVFADPVAEGRYSGVDRRTQDVPPEVMPARIQSPFCSHTAGPPESPWHAPPCPFHRQRCESAIFQPQPSFHKSSQSWRLMPLVWTCCRTFAMSCSKPPMHPQPVRKQTEPTKSLPPASAMLTVVTRLLLKLILRSSLMRAISFKMKLAYMSKSACAMILSVWYTSG